MLQYGDRTGKAKVAGVGHAGNTFALLEAGEPGNQGPHDGWRPAEDRLASQQAAAGLQRRAGEKNGAETVG